MFIGGLACAIGGVLLLYDAGLSWEWRMIVAISGIPAAFVLMGVAVNQREQE